MKFIRFIFTFSLTLVLIYFLNYRAKDAFFLKDFKAINELNPPALGVFMNPFGGFWSNAEAAKFPKDLRIKSDKLKDRVDILFDDRLIPHIFANNEYDLYFAQGYITAQFRLWQMEFQTHAAAGRLSEIVGEKSIEFDKFQRRIGMVYAAESSLKEMEKDETSKLVVNAYADGVNAYINQLQPKDYPIEYKLLGYAPEQWTPLKSALLQKYMAFDLSFRNDDLSMTNILKKYGKDITKELFPNYNKIQDPIIPSDTKFDFKKLDIPKVPKETTAPLSKFEESQTEEAKKGIGSNNWAIGAEKSATGYPILANDPHLTLNLPSIWFELQLVGPKVNVYGASLPGAPGITIGFNQDVAWGVTNVDSDVQDWYLVQFKDEQKKEYFHDKQWKPVQRRIEKIKVKGGKTVEEVVLFTHQGPVVAEDKKFANANGVPLNCALRWIAYEPSNDLLTFYQLNRAKNYEDYRKALTHYVCPAQNFIYADNHKDIAITPNGKFPLKWKEQGKFILDGSKPEHDWQGWIPYNQNPHVKNPQRGFVSSANQFSVSDSLYPYYLHWEFASYERGKRINDRLTQMQKASPDSLKNLQNDALSLLAQRNLPVMLKNLKKEKLKNEAQKVFAELEKWNYHHKANQIAPTVFKLWWTLLRNEIWKDQFGEDGFRYPGVERTGDLMQLNDTLAARWFDNINTKDKKETLEILVNQTYQASIDSLKKRCGNYGEKWQWAKYRNTQINHLARIPAFSIANILSDGDGYAVNATTSRTGPSWRMVVALGTNPKGYGIYPGGQSGNPGSAYYANFIQNWSKGELATLLYLKKATDNDKRIISKMRIYK